MLPRIASCLVILVLLGIQSSCAPVNTSVPEPGGQMPLDLGGDWEYEEGGLVQRLTLDSQGNGVYAWQNGRFVTTAISGSQWVGQWMQDGNDREGGFELNLSSDVTEADGTWWYTRIGSATFAPRERGGAFHLRRLGTVTAAPSR